MRNGVWNVNVTSEKHASQALKIALCQHCSGTFDTLSWLAAGQPDDGIEPEHLEVYQQARAIVHANGSNVRAGDVARLLERLRQRREARQ
jgi:hypothetical protein